ncbi:MAG: zinc-binding dehydrogenase [Christensenellales bacterium]
MSQMVKAALSLAPGKIEIREFPMPKLTKGSAIVKVNLAGICGTDKHYFKGETKQGAGTLNAINIPFPLVQGHENVVTIWDIDDEGSKKLDFDGNILKPGDRVTMCPDVVCGDCYYCKHIPNYPWCNKLQFGYGSIPADSDTKLYGGFAEYMYIAPGTRLYKVPEGLPDTMAVLTEPMCVTYSLDKAKEFYSFAGEGFGFGDTVVIQGVGPLGLTHVIKARMLGAGKIIVFDISEYKLEMAKAFGADVLVNSSTTTTEERIELVKQETRGIGADIAVDCTGVPEVIPEGLEMLRKAGMFIECGLFVDMGPTQINMHMVCAKNLRIIGMYNHSHVDYSRTMDMMLRNIDNFPWMKFISGVYPLDKTAQAIKKSMSPESMKIVINPWMNA